MAISRRSSKGSESDGRRLNVGGGDPLVVVPLLVSPDAVIEVLRSLI